ncbi:MAG: hypothetical protein WCQ46_06760 [Bacteroidales bacterium]
MIFILDFEQFLKENSICYKRNDTLFFFPDKNIIIQLVPLKNWNSILEVFDLKSNYASVNKRKIFLYEDRWYGNAETTKKRILAHLGIFTSVFARNCDLKEIESVRASDFLKKYHSYGTAGSKYKLGLFYKDKLIAVSTFSQSRPMKRIIDGQEKFLQSYEWVRYASLPELRISGGMGKLLKAFVDKYQPEEVMSYADKEWSDGDVYGKLGFTCLGEREPVKFLVNIHTFQRFSEKKLLQDRAYRSVNVIEDGYFQIWNMGSIKYLKQF